MNEQITRTVQRRPVQPMRLPAGLLLALVALILSACTSPGPKEASHSETRDPEGFTIVQDVRVGSKVRSSFDRAIRHLENGENEQGIVLLEQVTEAAPQLTSAHINLGIAYARTEDFESAEKSLKRAVELNPRHPVAHNELGIVYRRTGRFDDAKRSYESALAVHPEFHFARKNLAILCDMYLSNMECALEHYQLYSKAMPQDEKAVMWITDIRNRQAN